MCCTDAYTGLVAISSTEVVVTYDMLATTCPGAVRGKQRWMRLNAVRSPCVCLFWPVSVGPGADCDSIISIRLSVEKHG
eukprot:COSAG03_NODE_74_length_14441_cov_13.158974_13_plen_79_part_00